MNVGLIGRMLERGTEQTVIQPALPGTVIAGRFARDPGHFAVEASNRPHPPIHPDAFRPSTAVVEDGSVADLSGGAR